VNQKIFYPKRGDVIKVNLDPVMGHEQGGYRLHLLEEVQERLGPLLFA